MTDAQDLIGKTVLIGLTNYEANGALVGHEQMFGTVKAVDDRNVEIELDDGKLYYLPPDTSPFHIADRGEYRLRSTGKIVNDPDYICTYSITKPQKN